MRKMKLFSSKANAVYLLLCFTFLYSTFGLRESHTIRGAESWRFLSKFCFNPYSKSDEGTFEFDLMVPGNTTMNLVVYYDAPESWDKANNESLDCWQKTNIALVQENLFRLSSLSQTTIEIVNDLDVDSVLEGIQSRKAVRIKGKLVFAANQAQWFYFALANCNSKLVKEGSSLVMSRFAPGATESAIAADAQLTMLNGQGFEKEYSADEQGKFGAYLGFLFAYLFVFFPGLRYVIYSLKQKEMMHHTVRLLCISVIFEFLSVLFGFIYQLDYASRGKKAVWLDVIFRLMHAASDIFLLLLLIVIAKGWSVVRRKISAKGRVKIGVFCTAYSYTHYATILAYYREEAQYPEKNVYFYSSEWGRYLIYFRCLAAVWFAYATYTTSKNYEVKKKFYGVLLFTGILWIIALPIEIEVASNIRAYRRDFSVSISNLVLNIIFHGRFLLLFMPGSFNANFPFHAKTRDMEARPRLNRGRRSRTNRNAAAKIELGENERVPNVSSSGGDARGIDPSNPVGFNRVEVSNTRRRRGSGSVTGGPTFAPPIARLKVALKHMRSKLGKLYDISDDMEVALTEIVDDDDEENTDL
eukprot:g4598.t1